ncbi:MAG: tocopherol cyclase family protein [Pseudanabaenaceae cyanobacterium bins.39]|nr:tocopherol cyclase family protein [Pseudanabaenaceae cyanobacterium bins.39]
MFRDHLAKDLLTTPHSGFHWHDNQQTFFEGWYYRLTLPPSHNFAGRSLAFMYSFQAFSLGSSNRLKIADLGNSTVQVLGIDEQYFCRSLPNRSRFWASREHLAHGYTYKVNQRLKQRAIAEGYQVTPHLHKGQFWHPATSQIWRWHYTIEPVYGWGSPHSPQKSTAGWLSQWQLLGQIFEPGWQILMAHGWATGWFEIVDIDKDGSEKQPQRLTFEQVPAYAEKNWGGAFPQKWFWIQCNAFADEPDLSLTSGGGIRKVLGLEESVGMVGVHHRGQFYEFVPWNSRISWQVMPWGCWSVWAENEEMAIAVVGETAEAGTMVRVPREKGMQFWCRDTTRGNLRVTCWDRQGRSPRLIFSAHSQQAGLEIGGNWSEPWVSLGY